MAHALPLGGGMRTTKAKVADLLVDVLAEAGVRQINGLYDCHRSRVPVLAIAAQIPSSEIGSGYFQETHPEQLFAQRSHYCELASWFPIPSRCPASSRSRCKPRSRGVVSRSSSSRATWPC